jgi:hypothetical protein
VGEFESAAPKHFNNWAIVEMFGHVREVGYVTTQYFGTACLFQIDVPALPEREFTLTSPRYLIVDGESKWTPSGAKVKLTESPARSRLIGPGSIYSITPCTQEAAIKAIASLSETQRELVLLELPDRAQRQLLPGEAEDDGEEEDQE